MPIFKAASRFADVFFVFLVFIFVVFAFVQTAQAATIKLSWVEYFDRISPNPVNNVQLQKNLTLVLEGGRRISESWSAGAGGESYRWKEGAQLGQGWRVVGANQILRSDNFPNHTTLMKITMSGTACQLTVTYTLKPGAKYFINPMLSQYGRAGHYSRYNVGFAECKTQ